MGLCNFTYLRKRSSEREGSKCSSHETNLNHSVELFGACHLLKGHSEHRSNAWRPEEVYRTCVQALEGRCSRRSKLIHEQKLAIKEFIAKVEIILLNELGRSLESANEPDRRLISRLNRALTLYDSNDTGIYHVPSPSRPAWKTWNLDQEDPVKMMQVVDTVSELLQLPREESYEEENVHLKSRVEWNPRHAAEMIAASLGAKLPTDNLSLYSGGTSPDRRSDVSEADSRRRGNSVDSFRRTMPLEPNVFVRDRPSAMSFRERSVALDCSDRMHSLVGSPVPSHTSAESKPGSAMSSIPAYPCDRSFGSTASSTSQAVTPTPFTCTAATNGSTSTEGTSRNNDADGERGRVIGKNFLTRPICVQTFSTSVLPNHLAISDSCGGVYITDFEGRIKEHVLVKNSSASSVAIDEKNDVMYVSIMQSKGRSVYVFDIANGFRKLDVIPCPKDPKIEMSRTRWLTVGPRGQLFMVSGDNVKSAVWCYVRAKKAWKTLKESRKTRYQYISVAEDQAEYKAVVLLTCDAANNRLLLFVIDHTLSLINEYDLSKTYRLAEHISSPASAIVDQHGNLLVLDYANGKLWILLSGVKGIRRLKEIHFEEPLHSQEALGISASGDEVFVACFNRCEVRVAKYLNHGVLTACNTAPVRSPSNNRRSASLPRPPESQV
ncbi:hypothetical protein GCK32_002994 [Trichostrongylus colubriformis]|uniref:Uncharacterized protein n=1 Tax=Trichostrongylus colubriformis TaxID=6319 RepID=A0AAN8FV52_TRICO